MFYMRYFCVFLTSLQVYVGKIGSYISSVSLKHLQQNPGLEQHRCFLSIAEEKRYARSGTVEHCMSQHGL